MATLSSDKEKLEQYIKSRLEKLEQVHKEVRFFSDFSQWIRFSIIM